MKVLSAVFVFTALLALVVAWPNDISDDELSLQQSDEGMMMADGELSLQQSDEVMMMADGELVV